MLIVFVVYVDSFVVNDGSYVPLFVFLKCIPILEQAIEILAFNHNIGVSLIRVEDIMILAKHFFVDRFNDLLLETLLTIKRFFVIHHEFVNLLTIHIVCMHFGYFHHEVLAKIFLIDS